MDRAGTACITAWPVPSWELLPSPVEIRRLQGHCGPHLTAVAVNDYDAAGTQFPGGVPVTCSGKRLFRRRDEGP